MGKATEAKREKQSPRDTSYGEISPDDIDEGREEGPEESDEDANADDFERGKSQPGVRQQHKKQEQPR